MKNILVTGANGRIGRHVVPLLLCNGYRVTVAARKPIHGLSWSSDVNYAPLSLPAPEPLDDLLSGIDAVIHLAGIMPPAEDAEVFNTNVQGTRQLLQAAAASKNRTRFIFASSDATYSTGWSLSSYSAPIEESAAQHPTVFYGLSKVLGERLCQYYEEIHQLPIVRLRYVWTLEAHEILDLFLKAPYAEFLTEQDREKWKPSGLIAIPLEEDGTPFTEHVCDVRDAAEATVLALRSDSAPGQAFNIAGPEPFRYADVAPKLSAKMLLPAKEARCRGIHSYSLSIEKAKRLLGYKPRYGVMDSLEGALSKSNSQT